MLTPRIVAPAVLVLTLLLSGARAADVDPFAPADSEWVLQLNIKQLSAAPALKKNTDQLRTTLRSQSNILTPLTALDLDPLKDVVSITAAGSGLLKYDQALLIVRGSFDAEKLTQTLNALVKKQPTVWKRSKQGDATIYEQRDKARPLPAHLAVRNDGIILLSAGKKYVVNAVARDAKKPGKVSEALRKLVAKADDADDVWLAAVKSESIHRVLAKSSTTQGIADDVTAFTARIAIRENAEATFTVHTKDKKTAEEVAQLLDVGKGFASLAVLTTDGLGPLLSELLNACKTSTADTTATVSGQLSGEEVARALKKK